MADASYGAKQATAPDVQFATDLKAGKHTPYHKDEDRAALLAAVAAATANLGLQSTLASIDATLKAQADIAVSLWTDNSGAFYVRRDIIDQDSGVVTVTFTNPTGTAATPGAGLRPVANEESLHTETIRYVSNVSGTGHTAGDMIERVVVMDANASPPTVVSSAWVNLTTGAVMGTAPTIANLTANPTALPANAMTETTGAAILAKVIAAPAEEATQLDVLGEIQALRADFGVPATSLPPRMVGGYTGAVTSYAVNKTTTGALTVVAADAAKAYRLASLALSISGATTLTFSGGGVDLVVDIPGAGVWDLQHLESGHATGIVNTAFTLNSSNAVTIKGVVRLQKE